jgi:phytoene dehydrogenase-like protein
MGRGRLSGIELLPEECAPIVAWAAEELQKRERTQTEIYDEFYGKMDALHQEYRGELDSTIPSFSAFNRYSIRLATLTQRLNQTREIASTLASKFDAAASDDLTLIASEAIKTLVFELVTAGGEAGFDPKGAKSLADALFAATRAQGVSTARRQKVESEFEAKAKEAVKTVQKAKGLSEDAADEILDRILGVSK